MEKRGFSAVLKWIIRASPFIIAAVLVVLYFRVFHGMSIEELLSYTPESYLLTALVVIGLYALKSLSIIMPYLAIELAVSTIFSTPAALALNLTGVTVVMIIPYLVGRFAHREMVAELIGKYGALEKLKRLGSENELFTAYITRVVNLLPCDIVSMTFGATGMRFGRYITGSFIGAAPGVIATTFLGANLHDPASPVFMVSLAATAAVSAVSLLIYRAALKRQREKEE